jgi:hypothetical protein
LEREVISLSLGGKGSKWRVVTGAPPQEKWFECVIKTTLLKDTGWAGRASRAASSLHMRTRAETAKWLHIWGLNPTNRTLVLISVVMTQNRAVLHFAVR